MPRRRESADGVRAGPLRGISSCQGRQSASLKQLLCINQCKQGGKSQGAQTKAPLSLQAPSLTEH
jgi:hypothetical protein